jgi:hypothetical protein
MAQATAILSDPTFEDIGKASKSRAGWHRLALTATASHKEEKWLLKLTPFYNVKTLPSSWRGKQQCEK